MSGIVQHTIETPYMVGPVHSYSATIAGDLVLFDTGPPTEEARRYLRQHLDLSRLRHVLITHCHIDHYGLAAWLEEESDAIVYLPHRDCLKIEHHAARINALEELLAGLDFKEESLSELRRIFESGALFPPFPKRYLAVEEHLPAHLGIEVINCPGHSQSDVVYAGATWAVTGDTLLRGIFQVPLLDVDLVSGDRFNNYQAYCATFAKLAALHGRAIHPGHRLEIGGVEETLLFYITKLLQRVESLRPHRKEKNLMVLLDKLLGEAVQDVFTLFLKASEVVFMQDLLLRPELLQQALRDVGLFGRVEDLFRSAVGR